MMRILCNLIAHFHRFYSTKKRSPFTATNYPDSGPIRLAISQLYDTQAASRESVLTVSTLAKAGIQPDGYFGPQCVDYLPISRKPH